MTKVLLRACVCLMGLSAQASQAWRTELDTERAEQAAREYFQEARQAITREDIRDALRRFPTFLEWRFFGGAKATIAHVIGLYGCDRDVFYYFLGFSPNLKVVDNTGVTPLEFCIAELVPIFEEYKKNPWRHPDNVLELPVDHEEYRYDGKRFGEREDLISWDNDSSSQPSFFSNVVDEKVLGELGAQFYWYNSNKDKEQKEQYAEV